MSRKIALITLFLILLWSLGLALFYRYTHNLEATRNNRNTPIDTVIVLTGDSNRIRKGVEYFISRQAKFLLISGVNTKVKKAELLNLLKPLSPEPNKVFLGKIAPNTMGNAIETAIFIKLHKLNTIEVVTSNYHILRAKLLFSQVLPPNCNVSWVPVPGTSFTSLVNEYNKYLMTLISVGEDALNTIYIKTLKYIIFGIIKPTIKNS